MAKTTPNTPDTSTNEAAEAAWLAANPGHESQGWSANGRVKFISQETGEVTTMTRKQIAKDLAAAALPKRVTKSKGATGGPGGGKTGEVEEGAPAAEPEAVAAEAAEVVATPAPEGMTLKQFGPAVLTRVKELREGRGDEPMTNSQVLNGAFGSLGQANTVMKELLANGATVTQAAESILVALGEAPLSESERTGGTRGKGKAKGEKGKALKGKIKEQRGPSTGSTDALERLVTSYQEADRAEKRSSLEKGKHLYELDLLANEMRSRKEITRQSEVVKMAGAMFDRLGMKFPGESQRSQMRTTYEHWVVGTGVDPQTEFTSDYYTDEQGVPRTTAPDSDELLPIRMTDLGDFKMLERTKHIVTPDNIALLLAFLKMNNWQVISQVTADWLNTDNFEGVAELFKGMSQEEKLAYIARHKDLKERKAPTHITIRVDRNVGENFRKMVEAISLLIQEATPERLGEDGQVTDTVALDWLLELTAYIDRDQLLTVTKLMYASATEEDLEGDEEDAEIEVVDQADTDEEDTEEDTDTDDTDDTDEGTEEEDDLDEAEAAFA